MLTFEICTRVWINSAHPRPLVLALRSDGIFDYDIIANRPQCASEKKIKSATLLAKIRIKVKLHVFYMADGVVCCQGCREGGSRGSTNPPLGDNKNKLTGILHV